MNDYERGQYDMKQRASKLCFDMDSEQTCGACNGTGYYDHNGSPRCGSCEGKGEKITSPNDVGYLISKLEIISKE